MAQLLKPSGILVCLEFPLYEDSNAQGPLWGLKGVYWNLLSQGGDGIIREADAADEDGDSHKGKGSFSLSLYYKPDRTYNFGEAKEPDMISVWKLA